MPRLPAEWEPQDRILFVWPRDPLTWPDRVDKVREVFLGILETLHGVEKLDLLVHQDLWQDAETALATRNLDQVRLIPVDHQDSWIRDYGPLTVQEEDGSLRHLKFVFDSWGGKYEPLLKDDLVVGQLSQERMLDHPVTLIDEVLEGGAVETDGRGTFLATRSVAEGRDQTEEEHEEILREHLGATHVIWLEEGIEGDDTDGHIDTITRFVAPGVVVTSLPKADHPDYPALKENLEILQQSTDASGKPLEVHTLPLPEPVRTDEGDVLPAGHANFLIANEHVLVPTYGGPSDAVALELLGRLTGRQAVAVDHQAMIWGFGGIHCLSMQIPAQS